MHDLDSDYTTMLPTQLLPPGKRPHGPIPDPDPSPPPGPHPLPENPIAPEEDTWIAYAGLERLALRARVGPW